mmetsp:Transcript_12273/g.19959  ORF Transcript_12273/g.19959 Transcript_12273/m.19959 type:complete len:305 (-) Transcript_12273:36-950(-)
MAPRIAFVACFALLHAWYPLVNGGALGDELLRLAMQSPVFAGAHDKKGWIGLFDKDTGAVEDPVGAPEHKDIGVFYDTFIAPNNISFVENLDIVDEGALVVLRDVDIKIISGNGAKFVQPAILQYSFIKVGSQYRVQRLRAFWNALYLRPILDSYLDAFGAMASATMQFVGVVQNFGPAFSWEYTKGLATGSFSGGAKLLDALVEKLNSEDNVGVSALFNQEAKIFLPGKQSCTGSELGPSLKKTEFGHLSVSKVYQSGLYTAAVLVSRVPSCEDTCEERYAFVVLGVDGSKTRFSRADVYFET